MQSLNTMSTDNPIQKFLSSFSFLKSGSTGESVIGIDIGSSSIKLVQLKKKNGRAVLETYGALALGPYIKSDVGAVTNLTTDVLATAIKDLIKESGATTTNGAVAIPASSSLVFTIDLPAVIDEKALASIVPTEARKYIPVPISEVLLDYFVIPKREESISNSDGENSEKNKTEVLIAAIHNETIERYKDIIRKSGVTSSFYEIEMFSAIRSTFGHELSPVLLIDVGASKTKLSIVEYGIVKMFHIANRGSQDITNSLAASLAVPFAQAEEMKREFGLMGSSNNKAMGDIMKTSVDFILSEAQGVMVNYSRKYDKTVSKVMLTGGGVLLKGFHDAARTTLTQEVVMSNPFAKTDAPAFLTHVLETTGPEFATAVGLALRKLQ